ncbi:MAG: UvrY/SirA/GacA family response regulator transcription factor [Pseudomonadales bacterium]|nr:UvrY/SirA/GacA family response regulator transcription factor [Pseudomonadales bacterium]MDG1441250.1 UvrY/SirA/GacA family response regulator transcription factor [Pseudomonadales bacterium]
MIRIIVVDDHQLVREGTSRLLDDVEGFQVIGQGGSGEAAIDLVRELKPDVVLMDIQMPGIGGLEATRRCLRVEPELKVVMLTIHEQEPYPTNLLKIGAAGYLTKNADVDEMVRAIRRVVLGQRYIASDIAQKLALHPYKGNDTNPFQSLSSREMQITLMVIDGYKVPHISQKLSLSPKTVNSYRYRIFEKLDIHNDVGLTKMAIKYGIISAEAISG